MQLIYSDCKNSFSYHSCNISFLAEVGYERDGELHKVRPIFEASEEKICEDGLDLCDLKTVDKWNNEDIEITREISYVNDYSKQFRTDRKSVV